MKYDSSSQFPTKVDPLIFFSDISIPLKNDMDTYNKLANQNKYETANEFMYNSDMHGYIASLFNLMEERIYATQDYLKNHYIKPNRAVNFLGEPQDVSDEPLHETIWTGGDRYTYILEDDIEFASTSTAQDDKNWVNSETNSHLTTKDNLDQRVVDNVPTNPTLDTIWIGTEK